MTTTPHALISGAGIAGPALAHQLHRHGWRTTIVEQAPRLREEGQNVDVRGAARNVLDRMGLREAVAAATTTELGMRFTRPDGSAAASFPVSRSGRADGPTAELEILRGQLSKILYDRTREHTEYRFATRITDVVDDGDRVRATLDDETVVDSDVLIIAEGLRSRSRRFVTFDEVAELGMYFAYLTIPRDDSDDRWWNWMHAPGSRAVHLRPDSLGTTRAIMTFASEVRGLQTLRREDQVTILRRTFADVGGPCPRVLNHLDDGGLYFDAVGQFHTSTWVNGRIALLGDAAFCNGTFGGAGTSLSLIGAHVMAGELAATDDHGSALDRYQQVMTPIAATAPPVGAKALRRMNPATPTGIRVLHAGAKIAATPIAQTVIDRLGMGNVNVADAITLPRYGDEQFSDDHAPAYAPPSRWEKLLSSVFARTNIAERLTVTGRHSGQPRHVAVNTVTVDGIKYLVSARGDSQWVKNVRHDPRVALTIKGHTTTYIADEVRTDQRPPILAVKFGHRSRSRFAANPPNPNQHPTFALTPRQ